MRMKGRFAADEAVQAEFAAGMAEMKVKWTEAALQQLHEAYDYIRSISRPPPSNGRFDRGCHGPSPFISTNWQAVKTAKDT